MIWPELRDQLIRNPGWYDPEIFKHDFMNFLVVEIPVLKACYRTMTLTLRCYMAGQIIPLVI